MDELLILLLSRDSFTDYICNYLLMDGHYVDVAEDMEMARFMIQIRKYDLVFISFATSKEEETIITRQLQKIDPTVKLIFLFQFLTQKAAEISHQDRSFANVNPVKSFMLENLPFLIEQVKLNKILENFAPPSTVICDRRKEARAIIKIPVKYFFQDIHESLSQEEMISRGMDLSKDGIKLIVDDSTIILPYVSLNVLLPFSADPVRILGETKWARGHLRFPWKDVGVKFFNARTEDILRIADYLNLFFVRNNLIQ